MTIRFVPGPAKNGYEWAFCEGERKGIYLVYCLNVCMHGNRNREVEFLKLYWKKGLLIVHTTALLCDNALSHSKVLAQVNDLFTIFSEHINLSRGT